MSRGDILEFGAAQLDALSRRAAVAPRLRQHLNIHKSYDEPCQRLLNAIEPGSYLRPYRHAVVPRDKLLVALRGLFAVVLFQDDGTVAGVFPLSANPRSSENAAVEVGGSCWNSVVSLAPGSVLLEVKAGPFDPDEPRVFPAWAPEEGGAEARTFVRSLNDAVKRRLAESEGGIGQALT